MKATELSQQEMQQTEGGLTIRQAPTMPDPSNSNPWTSQEPSSGYGPETTGGDPGMTQQTYTSGSTPDDAATFGSM